MAKGKEPKVEPKKPPKKKETSTKKADKGAKGK